MLRAIDVRKPRRGDECKRACRKRHAVEDGMRGAIRAEEGGVSPRGRGDADPGISEDERQDRQLRA